VSQRKKLFESKAVSLPARPAIYGLGVRGYVLRFDAEEPCNFLSRERAEALALVGRVLDLDRDTLSRAQDVCNAVISLHGVHIGDILSGLCSVEQTATTAVVCSTWMHPT
jgi:hypothetical protein